MQCVHIPTELPEFAYHRCWLGNEVSARRYISSSHLKKKSRDQIQIISSPFLQREKGKVKKKIEKKLLHFWAKKSSQEERNHFLPRILRCWQEEEEEEKSCACILKKEGGVFLSPLSFPLLSFLTFCHAKEGEFTGSIKEGGGGGGKKAGNVLYYYVVGGSPGITHAVVVVVAAAVAAAAAVVVIAAALLVVHFLLADVRTVVGSVTLHAWMEPPKKYGNKKTLKKVIKT